MGHPGDAAEDAVRLEVLTLAGESKGTWNVAPTGSYSLTNAALTGLNFLGH